MADWYRCQTWSKTDEENFFIKLNRAKKDNRAQYLKIQAVELVETKDLKLLDVAETLLQKMLIDYPGEKIFRAEALRTLGDIYKIRNDYDKAISYYKEALDFEKKFPETETNAYLGYSELVIKTNLTSLFPKVERILKKQEPELFLPEEKYKVYCMLAILSKYRNLPKKAGQYAKLAEENAGAKKSGLRYHKDLGLVDNRDEWLDREAGLI